MAAEQAGKQQCCKADGYQLSPRTGKHHAGHQYDNEFDGRTYHYPAQSNVSLSIGLPNRHDQGCCHRNHHAQHAGGDAWIQPERGRVRRNVAQPFNLLE